MAERPKIGVGVFVVKGGKILLGKRMNAHGDGTWSLPGGHLEMNEEPEDCARREVMEEAGIKIKNLSRLTFTNDIFEKEKKHYVTLFLRSDLDSGVPAVMEPDKCERWDWFTWDDLPRPLFMPLKNLKKECFDPFKD
ncbi:DNA mismatch repair protein MutT [Candidatus Woesearchaeota archaeon CG11_big_fil_rev_8_21_14_0_20_43_8]|nr:MAG: DNA mismatch repair protein MutT [Candidatus Woesearchaeota archaeon CG11_big_fil_rev_8_21_14_0_20_43_8]PIO06813.1 MAG: DNA mismatch repair protein MutT [Candidatus Woesearchaeota archaeon CG08_land_8_20_14_0_20_43_7]